jgi:phosphoglycolate phosphatase
MQLLRALRSNNLQVAVATGKSRAGLDRVLSQSGVSSLFHATRCADETASKPDPKMLFEILESLSVPVDEAIMIGDTTYDLEMAASAGMRSIGVAHGVHSVESLEKHSPVAVVRDLIELAPLLASL